ncbi:hypothetical protein [Actinokineospora sp. NPDC004072]
MAAAGRVAIGALVGAATAALLFEGIESGTQLQAAPEVLDHPMDPDSTHPPAIPVTLISATSATPPPISTTTTSTSTSTTTTTTTTTTSITTTTTTQAPPPTTTTTTAEPPPPPPPTTTTTTRRPCGILWCP